MAFDAFGGQDGLHVKCEIDLLFGGENWAGQQQCANDDKRGNGMVLHSIKSGD